VKQRHTSLRSSIEGGGSTVGVSARAPMPDDCRVFMTMQVVAAVF
jgi:hypothetical protein